MLAAAHFSILEIVVSFLLPWVEEKRFLEFETANAIEVSRVLNCEVRDSRNVSMCGCGRGIMWHIHTNNVVSRTRLK